MCMDYLSHGFSLLVSTYQGLRSFGVVNLPSTIPLLRIFLGEQLCVVSQVFTAIVVVYSGVTFVTHLFYRNQYNCF